jgi:hypothetical protein
MVVMNHKMFEDLDFQVFMAVIFEIVAVSWDFTPSGRGVF